MKRKIKHNKSNSKYSQKMPSETKFMEKFLKIEPPKTEIKVNKTNKIKNEQMFKYDKEEVKLTTPKEN